jgi:very-short-patch-repair endonuclease
MWKKLTKSEVLNKFYCVHSDDYDYSLMDYKGTKVKINIICPIHGLFSQTPANHFIGRGCPKCSGNDKKTTNDFKDKLIKIYGNTLDYSLLNYVNIRTKVKLICKEHGEFEIFPKHLIYDNHQGCYKCENKRVFIEKAKEVHEDKYNYDLVKYDNAHDNVLIVCKKHGAFEQLAYQHINGSGCPRCSESKGEKQIRNYLIKNNIDYENQKKFEDCKYISTLKYDFYLPKYNLCIEYDGQQHFILKNYWGGEKEFEKIQKRDKIKTQYCRDNNINLLRIKYSDNILEKLNTIK